MRQSHIPSGIFLPSIGKSRSRIWVMKSIFGVFRHRRCSRMILGTLFLLKIVSGSDEPRELNDIVDACSAAAIYGSEARHRPPKSTRAADSAPTSRRRPPPKAQYRGGRRGGGPKRSRRACGGCGPFIFISTALLVIWKILSGITSGTGTEMDPNVREMHEKVTSQVYEAYDQQVPSEIPLPDIEVRRYPVGANVVKIVNNIEVMRAPDDLTTHTMKYKKDGSDAAVAVPVEISMFMNQKNVFKSALVFRNGLAEGELKHMEQTLKDVYGDDNYKFPDRYQNMKISVEKERYYKALGTIVKTDYFERTVGIVESQLGRKLNRDIETMQFRVVDYDQTGNSPNFHDWKRMMAGEAHLPWNIENGPAHLCHQDERDQTHSEIFIHIPVRTVGENFEGARFDISANDMGGCHKPDVEIDTRRGDVYVHGHAAPHRVGPTIFKDEQNKKMHRVSSRRSFVFSLWTDYGCMQNISVKERVLWQVDNEHVWYSTDRVRASRMNPRRRSKMERLIIYNDDKEICEAPKPYRPNNRELQNIEHQRHCSQRKRESKDPRHKGGTR